MKGIIIALALALNANADAASDPFFKRISDWQLSYDERSCDLVAKFGDGKDQIAAVFSRYGPSDLFSLSLIGSIVKTSSLRSEITIDFGPFDNPHHVEGLNGTVGILPSTSITSLRLDDAEGQGESDLPSIKEEDEAKVNSVKLVFPRKRVVQLQLGSMAKPMHAMRTCTDGLMKAWGLNPEEQKSVIARPKPSGNPRNWLRSSDYPLNMLREGQSAIVRFRLDISETGEVAVCHSYTSDKTKQFGDITCRLLSTRARFYPAENSESKPIRSFYIGTVNWLMGHR